MLKQAERKLKTKLTAPHFFCDAKLSFKLLTIRRIISVIVNENETIVYFINNVILLLSFIDPRFK